MIAEERAKSLLFMRPRRFGKTLFLSTLESFHNILYKEKFDQWFKKPNLKIANMNIEPNTYIVIRFDFSTLEISETICIFNRSINCIINDEIIDLKKTLLQIFPKDIIEDIIVNPNDGVSSFKSLCNFAKNRKQKLYVLIDEYDTQMNNLLKAQNSPIMQSLSARNQDDDSKMSSFRRFFSQLKISHGRDSNLRSFITGVCPMALNEFTSGFNIAMDITYSLLYADLCGITKKDLENVIKNLDYHDKTINLVDLMIQNYNGYSFHPDQEEELINPTLASRFLYNLTQYGKLPETMHDKNTSISENSLQLILKSPVTERLVESLMTSRIYKMTEAIDVEMKMRDLMTNEHTLLQLLFHFGAVTFCKKSQTQMRIPNQISFEEYLKAILEISKFQSLNRAIEKIKFAFDQLVKNKNIDELCRIIIEHNLILLKFNDVVHAKEQDLKVVFLFALAIVSTFGSVESEHHLKKDNRYCDILLKKHNIHIECKNVTSHEILLNSKNYVRVSIDTFI